MAKTITQLPDATVVNAADELIVQQGGVTKRATKTEVLNGIVNANIDAAAAIAHSKLAALNSGQIIVGNGSNVPTAVSVTGDVTISNAGVTAIADAAITAAKLSGAQTGSAPIYGCRAWVNFNGDAGSTVDGEFRCTIRASGNVSKVVRTGGVTGTDTGVYLVTLTTAMSDSNYSAVCSIKAVDDSARHYDFVAVRPESASVIRIVCSAPASPFNGVNAGIVSLAIFR